MFTNMDTAELPLAEVKKAPRISLNSDDLALRLRARYAAPSYAFFEQVRDGTGSNACRAADGLAMSLWPSRGMEVEGFEIKVSRSDWQSELKNPGKAEPICRFCDRWWIVTPDADIVRPGELPPTWGLLIADAKGLRAKVDAPRLTASPLDRNFVAAVLRAAWKESPAEAQLALAKSEGRREGIAEGEESANRQKSRAVADAERLQQSVKDFEEASGVQIDGYNGHRIGEAVKLASRFRRTDARRNLKLLHDQAERMVKECSDLLTAIPPEESSGT